MKYDKAFDKFSSFHVLVIGDVMLDAYRIGKVSRISPEAPVPVVLLEEEDNRIGGAGNVALNLIALGAKATVCSIIGDDEAGKTLIQLFEKNTISTKGIKASKNRKTTVKTRVIANHQQLLRIDAESTEAINDEDSKMLLRHITDLIHEGVDAIIFEDYNKGILSEDTIGKIISLAKEHHIPTCVDPKKDNFLSYKGVDLFKPNLKELKEGLNIDFDFNKDAPEFINAVKSLEDILQNKISLITLSENGVFIKNATAQHFLPAHIRNISDVSGAGDTVISVACLCLLAEMPIEDIAAISNIAGGMVCEYSGVVSIKKGSLLNEIHELLGE